MPDIDFQKIVLNLIPKKGDEPVIFYASQYETARPFIADLMWGDTEFAPGDDCWAEIDIRKNDDNLVVITEDVAIDNNEVSVILPIQAVTCIGNNLGQVKIYAGEDQLISALNFILHVQPDPLAGGVTSESDIDNLTQQIEDIATEVIGEDYYDKTEVDALLNDKADVSDLPDMSQYYTKTATDTLLSAKADAATTYTKSETDSLLSAKANTADLATVATTGDYDDLLNKPTIPAAQVQSDYAQADNTQVDYIKNKPDISGMIADALLAVMPVDSATGNPCTFDTDIATSLVGLSADIVASQASGTPTPSNPLPISGISSLEIVRCGVNLWDEETESGYINADGSYGSSATALRSANFCKCGGGITVRFVKPAGYDVVPNICWYDENQTFIERSTTSGFPLLTSPANARYFKISMWNYGATYNNDVSINYPSTDTSYHAYNGQTFTIDLGGTRYGGVYTADGKLTLTHVKIDLGSLIYGADTNRPGVFYAGISDVVSRTECLSETYNCIMRGVPAAADLSNYDNSISTWDSYGRGIYIIDTAQAATSASDFKTLVTGVDFVYELATPIEIDVSSISVVAVSGVNNITSNGNGDVTAQYKVSIQKYIDDHV